LSVVDPSDSLAQAIDVEASTVVGDVS